MKLVLERIIYRSSTSEILNNVNVEIEGPTVVGILGPNGSGKSTLANLISGLIRPTIGRILLGRDVLTTMPAEQIAARHVARQFQTNHLSWNASALENVQFAIDRRRAFQPCSPNHNFETDLERASRILDDFGLSHQACIPARYLSFGQQRLLGIACIDAWPRDLVILDEPFAGLKDDARSRVYNSIREMGQSSIVLVIDHAHEALRQIATRYWFIEAGALLEFANYSEMVHSSALIRDQATSSDTHEFGVDARNAEDRPTLTIRNATFGYNGVPFVSGVCLDLRAGEVVAIIGANGSGKSTLLRGIIGLAEILGGSICLDSLDISSLSTDARARAGVRFLPQHSRLFSSLSIRDNLLLAKAALPSRPAELTGMPLRGRDAAPPSVDRGSPALDSRLLGLLDRSAEFCSGGEQSVIAMMHLAAGSPRVILLDEPTAGLDSFAVRQVAEQISEWSSEGIAIVVVEHDDAFLRSIAARTLSLTDGSLREEPRDWA